MESRREFIKKGSFTLLTAAGVAGTKKGFGQGLVKRWAMVIDLNRCTGCQTCVVACKAENRTCKGQFNTTILHIEEGKGPDVRQLYCPIQCNQCENPPCLKACSEEAIVILPEGIVATDWDRCRSHGDCIEACPYGARFPDSEYGNKADKCNFCLHRLKKGLLPVCVEACPSGARLFGEIDDPTGEFAAYIKQEGNKGLKVRLPEFRTSPRVFYKPLNNSRSGGMI